MSAALTLSFDDAQLQRLDKAAAERRMSREALVQDVLAAFLEGEDDSEFAEWQPVEQDRNPVSGLLPWQEERVERGRADIARGAVVSEANLDRVRRKYD